MQFNPSTATAIATIKVYDYGASFVVKATPSGGNPTYLSLPYPSWNAWLPEPGWWVPVASGWMHVDSSSLSPEDDLDTSANNSHNGDGFTVFEEYRGFIAQGVHRRTDPAVKDLFVVNALPQPDLNAMSIHTGDIPALGINVIEADVTDLGMTNAVNANASPSPGFGYPNPQHYSQKGLLFEDGGVNSSFSTVDGGTEHPFPFAGPASVDWIKVYVNTLRRLSPFTNDLTTPDAVDAEKAKQVLAHEAGHAVMLARDTAQGVDTHPYDPTDPATINPPGFVYPGIGYCPLDGSTVPANAPPGTFDAVRAANTVMNKNYFGGSRGSDPPACAWNHIPHTYSPTELADFQLR